MCEQCSDTIECSAIPDKEVICSRCSHRMDRYNHKSLQKTWVFSLTALILYVPALYFPFMIMELNGNRTSATIWQGVVSLAEGDSWLIAIIVLLASIVIPLVKLIVLFYIAMTPRTSQLALLKLRLYRFIEGIGRWSMLDIFLLAVMVAIIKFNPWTFVEPGIGSFMFAGVVIFTMLASASFDPRLLWENQRE